MTHIKTFSTLCLLLTFSAQISAQTPTPTPRKAQRTGKPKGEADPLAAQRRAQAVALLTTLADEAAGFRDETLRARAQARAADALWETDQEKTRGLFRRAWEAADSADREALRKLEECMDAQLKRGGPAMSSTTPDLDFSFAHAALEKKDAEGAVARAQRRPLSVRARVGLRARRGPRQQNESRPRTLAARRDRRGGAPHRQQRPRPRASRRSSPSAALCC